MSIKKVMKQLEKHIELSFPNYKAKFYSNRQNFYIHLGLDISLFSFENYKDFLDHIDKFLTEHLVKDFKRVHPPKLVLSTRWKHDYIIRTKVTNG